MFNINPFVATASILIIALIFIVFIRRELK